MKKSALAKRVPRKIAVDDEVDDVSDSTEETPLRGWYSQNPRAQLRSLQRPFD